MHLVPIVFFNTLWKLWFFMFSGGINNASVMKCIKMRFLCVDNFWSMNLECEASYLIVQKSFKIKIQKGSKGFPNQYSKGFHNQVSKGFHIQNLK